MVLSSSFQDSYQTATLQAGESGTILSIKIPESMVGFIKKIANSWFPNTTLYWYIDGELYKTLTYEAGDVNRPEHIDPPILVKSEVKFTAVNNDSAAHTFEVLCDGETYLKGEVEE